MWSLLEFFFPLKSRSLTKFHWRFGYSAEVRYLREAAALDGVGAAEPTPGRLGVRLRSENPVERGSCESPKKINCSGWTVGPGWSYLVGAVSWSQA